MRKLITITVTLLMSSAAFAQTAQQPQPSPQTSPQQGQAPQQGTAKIAQQIRKNLQQAGFKNIKMMPSSFLVRAEDQNNNPVMMVINPDSITTMTASSSGGTDQSTVGQQIGSSPSADTARTNPASH